MDIISNFIDSIQEFIILNDMTPASFARKVGCKERCVAKWLNYKNSPSLKYVILVADYMNKSVDFLCGLVDNPDFSPANPRSDFATRFANLVAKEKISFNKLSEICGISSSTMSKYLLHGQLPKLEKVYTLANYFNCSIDYLIGRSNIN